MVIVKISGGLGNQLFQYAFGQYVAAKVKTTVLYDIQTDLKRANFTSRDFALANFNLNIEKATEKDVSRILYFTNSDILRLERKLVQMFPFINPKYVVEKNFQSEFVKSVKDNCYYDGYWQSYLYLESIESFLKSKITINSEFVKDKSTIIQQISNLQSVSIHIRRGDYISIKANSGIFRICGLDYYDSAINYINSMFDNAMFYVFSDDIDWAKKHFIGSHFCFMEANDPFIDLYLMSLCKHNVIANSTFSWWGAWLNSNVNKVVLAPKEWYVGKLNKCKNELIPQSWIKI